MKIKFIRSLFALALTVALTPIVAHAQLRITEAQSNEAGTGHADWWELSNFGISAIDLTGYKFDDNSSNVVLNGISVPALTIAAGESIVFVEGLTYSTFTNWWNLTSSVQVGTYSGSGISLGSGGDQLNLWDASSNLVDYVFFGAATVGHTFDQFDPVTRQATHESVDGLYGAYTTGDGNIGSPGVIPEPSTFAITGLGLAVLLKFRRSRKK